MSAESNRIDRTTNNIDISLSSSTSQINPPSYEEISIQNVTRPVEIEPQPPSYEDIIN